MKVRHRYLGLGISLAGTRYGTAQQRLKLLLHLRQPHRRQSDDMKRQQVGIPELAHLLIGESAVRLVLPNLFQKRVGGVNAANASFPNYRVERIRPVDA